MNMAIWCAISFIIGMLLMAYASIKDREEIQQQHSEVMKMAKKEVDEANERAEKAEAELIVKQNIIDSLGVRINKQHKIITRYKKRNGEQEQEQADVC